MKVLGISGSPRKDRSTDRLVNEVLSAAVGCETEFVSLAGKKIGPCVACLRCVKDNVCKVDDDMQELRQKIVDADAYVIGSATHFSMINGLSHCFLERFYQFGHREGTSVRGKMGVAVGIGGGSGDKAIENLKTFFQYYGIECVGTVSGQGVAGCFTCGFGETCKTGAIHRLFGAGTRITPETTPGLDKQPDVLIQARNLGKKLGDRLRGC
jgi:multimeric flavodoxin WrbA